MLYHGSTTDRTFLTIVRRLELVEKKLMKDTQLANAYQGVIDEYLKKGYIRLVPPSEPQPESKWFLPHFPVVRPDRATTKVSGFVFGGCYCPFCAQFTWQTHAENHRIKYPLAAEAV